VFPLQGAARGVLTARVYDSDLALALTVADRNVVLVLGYLGEPAIRVDHAGVNGRHTRLAGEIRRVRAPAVWPWFALGIPFICAIALLFLLGRPQYVHTAALAFGLLASGGVVASAAGFAFDRYSSGGKWVEAGNELIFVLVGVLVILRGSPDAGAIAGGALGLLDLAVGLSKIPVLLHGVVLSALPAEVARTFVVLTIWGGGAATAAGLGVFTNLLESPPAPL
jgi:hypothetical protein